MLNPKMLKQLEQMQKDMVRAQEDLAHTEVEGTAGGGAVTVVANGHSEIQRVTIDPEFVDPDDVETLQDAILAACHDAQRRAQELQKEKLAGATGGLPGLDMFGL
jgi:DNA-binding YbaB/EbfC family protein